MNINKTYTTSILILFVVRVLTRFLSTKVPTTNQKLTFKHDTYLSPG